MGGLFKTPTVKAPAPVVPKPATEAATFKAGESGSAANQTQKAKQGKKRLQIGANVSGGSGLNTGA